ncbi:MAG: DUF2339 domain-containing protein [Acidobacteria bacterium]|nr:DUF2339 domain-containing protein [Acidobacteriota bacterium]
METLFILAAIAFTLAGPVAFAMALKAGGRSKRLEERVLDLERRLESAERRPTAPSPAAAAVAVQAPVAAPAHGTSPVIVPSFRTLATARPLPAMPPPAASRPAEAAPPTLPRRRDVAGWEAKIGGSWLNRIGVTMVVIGIAFALGYSLTVLGPAGKAALAALVSISMLAAGIAFEKREAFRLYGHGLVAGGWAALYATAYAVHELEATRLVEDPVAGFALLMAVGAAMIVHSLRYRSEGITALAYALAYAAICLHSISAYTLFAGTILSAGMALHLLRRQWYRLALGGVVATYGCLFLWYTRQAEMTAATLKIGLSALCLDWLTFLIADFAPESPRESDREHSRAVALVNAMAAGGLSWLAWNRFDAAGSWVPLAALGLCYAVTSAALRSMGRAAVHPVHSVAAALCVGFAAFEGLDLHGATWIWLAEAQAIVLIGVALKDRFHRTLGCALFLAPTLAIVADQASARMDRVEAIWVPSQFALTAAACAAFYLTFARLRAFALRRLFSFGALALILLGLWVQLPRVYVAPAGALLMVILFELSSVRRIVELRVQSYVTALFTAAAAATLTAPSTDELMGHAARLPALLAVAVAFFVVFASRRRESAPLTEFDVTLQSAAPWTGTALVALTVWLSARPVMVGPAWILAALALVEAGIALRERALRQPGYALLLCGHASLLVSNLTATEMVSGVSIRAATIVPSILASYYLWWRLREAGSAAAPERVTDGTDEGYGRFLAYAAGAMTGLFVRFQFGLDGAALRWSLTMVGLLVAGHYLRDADLRLQGYLLGFAAFLRAVGLDLDSAPPILGMNGPFCVATASVASFLAAAILLRARRRDAASRGAERRTLPLESRLEAMGFDVMSILAVAIAAVYSYRTASGSMLIVAWAIEGLVVTAAGFLIQARTLRFAGLGLLTTGLAMTIYRTVTTFDTFGRIVSFLVLGSVLLLVSYAYTRFRGPHRTS